VAEFCRLEYLTRKGWVVGHAGVALLNPQGYVDRLHKAGKIGRAVVLGEDFQPLQTFEPPEVPDPQDVPESILERLYVPRGSHSPIPVLRPEGGPPACDLCGAADHLIDWECLL
jgi:hypothetical protein